LVEVGAALRVLLRIDDGELPRELALGIVRAADEGAEPAELQAKPAVAAGRAEVRPQLLVELVQHLADAEVLGLADSGREGAPELAQHLAPVDLAVGDVVQLFLEMGGEVVLDVAGEIGLQEGGHDATAVFGNEALAVEPDIVTALQDFNDRGVGRGPADAELLEL